MPRTVVMLAVVALALAMASVVTPRVQAAPANDAFASRAAASPLPFTSTVDTTTATLEAGEPQPCGSSTKTVWYSFTPSVSALYQVDTQTSNFDTVIAVYTGTALNALSLVDCLDDSPVSGGLLIEASAGVEYLVQAGGYSGAAGSLALHIAQAPPAPANDNFASAVAVGGVPFSDQRFNASATVEPDELIMTCSDVEKTVWYTFTPAVSGTYQFDTFGSDFDTVLTVYTGSALSALSQVDCNDDSDATTRLSLVQTQLAAGTTYRIQVGGFSLHLGGAGTAYGSLVVHVSSVGSDTDGDGCTDTREFGLNPKLGGDRNPLDRWDFFDVTGDGIIDLQDTLLILDHFGHAPGTDPTDATLDRYAPDASKPYRTAAASPANDGIDLLDALTNLASFGHSCV